MKTILALGLILGLEFNPSEITVEKIHGVEVYVYATPAREYEVIDTGKVIATLTGSCNANVTQAASKAAKLKADAVLVDLGTPVTYTAIRWK